MTDAEKLLLAAIALQVGLTIWLGIALSVTRFRLVMSGQVRIADVALDASTWPARARQLGNAFSNQFELPVLFYVAALIALAFDRVDWVIAAVSIGFVCLRLLQTAVHVTSNAVVRRFQLYSAGLALLAVLWADLLAGLVIAG